MTPITTFFTSSVKIPGGFEILSRKKENPEPFCVSLINLSELEEKIENSASKDIPVTYLSPEEQEIFKGFTYIKRKREWLGGRLAAKHAILALSGSPLQIDEMCRISVLPQKNGAPTISCPSLSGDNIPSLSISHSHNYAVALAAASVSCGVDIQKISDKTERVADRFCEDAEVSLLEKHTPQLTIQERFTLLWSAKEALKKSLLQNQPTIFQGVTLTSVALEKYFVLQFLYPEILAQPASVFALMLDDYMLTYTMGKHRDA